MDELDPRLRGVADELRRPVEPDPAAVRRLRAAVRAAAEGPAWRRWLRWTLRPRPVSLSPAGVLAVLVATAAITALGTARLAPRGAEGGPPAVAAAHAPGTRPVRFVLVLPGAHSVHLVGDFNDWSPGATPLADGGEDGVWSVTLPLADGRYAYSFLVDGARWTPDPQAPPAPGDDFGRPSSVLFVEGST
ncbi:MAG TPA: isoamylase early set domain-containing protein [Longimicrobiaceae bacterium]|nr:isoamylase early set domain-containing protein [Longimicrobiaceae bacterium]